MSEIKASTTSTHDVSKAPTPNASLDKFYELDFQLVKEESNSRTEFNRRILNLQVSVVTALLAAGLFKDLREVDPFTIQFICVSVIALNAVFLLEINQNNFYITLAGNYLAQIINHRARLITGAEFQVSEWETFLSLKRNMAAKTTDRLSFLLDAHFALSILLIAIPTIFLCQSLSLNHVDREYIILPFAFIGYSVNLICIYRHFAIPRELRYTSSLDEIAKFEKVYGFPPRDENARDPRRKRRWRKWFPKRRLSAEGRGVDHRSHTKSSNGS